MTTIDMIMTVVTAMMATDLVLMFKAFRKKNDIGRALGMTLLSAYVTTTSYFCSIFMHHVTVYAILHGIYFSGVTCCLVCLTRFMMLYTDTPYTGLLRTLWRGILGYASIDVLIQLTNPLHKQALWYEGWDTPVSVNHFRYVMYLPFDIHLLFCYLLLILVMYLLFRKIIAAPTFYWRKYWPAVGILAAVVGVNAMYLYLPSPSWIGKIDYSLLGYCIAALAFYWLTFHYSRHGLATYYQSWAVDSLPQGVLLFDYLNKLIMFNRTSVNLLSGIKLYDNMPMEDLMSQCGISNKLDTGASDATFQFYQQTGGAYPVPLKGEYHRMTDGRGRFTGCMLVISHVVQQTDPLSGFVTWDYFLYGRSGVLQTSGDNGVCVVCDINGLSQINDRLGRTFGDQAIQQLAGLMQQAFPRDALFLRCREANLAVLCPGVDEREAHLKLQQINHALAQQPEDERFTIQSAVQRLSSCAAADSVERTLRIIRIKKLMDRTASHSDLLNSIIQILQECDQDTEAHVRRTQGMCIKLGMRLNLSDDDLSRLSLLAILHDIGKVGVPLDILNKPGKLAPDEWNVIKSHAEKGARIAASSTELSDFSDLILYHHERWDGKGYPAGLSKESIPLLSRIISVVDSYDAMVFNRSYRKSLGREKAMAELKRCAGTQFDPMVVSVFLDMLGDEQPAAESPAAEATPEEVAAADEWSWRGTSPIPEDVNVYVLDFALYTMDPESVICEVNSQFTQLTGYTAEDVKELKLTQRDLVPAEDWMDYSQKVIHNLGPAGAAYIEHRLLRKDGSLIRVFCLGRDFYDSARRSNMTQVFVVNVESTHAVQKLLEIEHSRAFTQLERWENKYRQDSLTGLLSHEAFRNDVEHKLLTGEKRHMMVMMDLDHFKQVNDRLGHRAGDEYLILMAQTLTGLLHEGELASRMGGDEFAVMLNFSIDTTDETILRRGAELCEQLNLVISTRTGSISGVSCGGAIAREGLTQFDLLYEDADKALYKAKNMGRGCFRTA